MASAGGFHGVIPRVQDKVVHVTFASPTGDLMRVAAYDGQSLYEVANKHDIFIGNSYTCHVVLSPASFAAHDAPMDEEKDELKGFMESRRRSAPSESTGRSGSL
ncbi:hypothetical protein T484DRAFT_1931642, partial [Baffinella frigidus]